MDKKNTKSLIIFSGILLVFFVLMYVNAFVHLRATLTDRLYSGNAVLDNIVIVKIDDESIGKIGRWPWNRDVFAKVLDKIKDARAVGVDVSFFEHSKNDDALANRLRLMKNVVLAAEVNNGVLYKPIFATDYGYVNMVTDNDGVTRMINLHLQDGVLPFAFELYKKSWDARAKVPEGISIINFAAGPGMFESYSVDEVLKGNQTFKNDVVLIGATAPDLHDAYFVPTSRGKAMSGVEIHAHILQNLVLDNFIRNQGIIGETLFVFMVGIIGMFFISKMRLQHAAFVVIFVLIAYALVSIFLFSRFNYLLDLFFVPLSLVVFTSTGIELNYLEEKKQNAFLTDAFGRYISKNLLKQIITHKQELTLGGKRHTITIFFSDIRGFTSISEKLSPEQLVSLLNEYLTAMTRIILDHDGTLDKFIGDAIMAFWNAPLSQERHAQLACACTIAQVKALKPLQKKWVAQGLPHIDMGCGLNTGDAIIGNMGSDDRFDYTAISDTVNLASRLEGLTKTYGVHIVISETTHGVIKTEFPCRKLDAVKVKGKKIPVTIYELCIEYDEKFVEAYEHALELYFKRKFREAVKAFKKALVMKAESVSCKLFIDRCEHFIDEPPADDWDGSYEMKTK